MTSWEAIPASDEHLTASWTCSYVDRLLKPPIKSTTVRFRAFPKELAGWRRLARADGMTLSTWIRDSLNARFDEPFMQPPPKRRGSEK